MRKAEKSSTIAKHQVDVSDCSSATIAEVGESAMGLEVGKSAMDCEEVRETRQVRQYRNELEPTGLSEPTPDPVYRKMWAQVSQLWVQTCELAELL